MSTEPSPFEQLSALVQADAEREPLRSQTGRPTVAERPAVQMDPSPFERLFAAVDSGDKIQIGDPTDSRRPVPPAESVSEIPEPGIVRTPRGRMAGQWRVIAVVGTVSLLLAGWGVYGILSQTANREERGFTARKAEVEKERGLVRASHELKKRARPAAEQRDNDMHDPPAVAGSKVESDVDREMRRENGQWREIATFEGVSKHHTSRFQVGAGGWRFRWMCDRDATIRLLDGSDQPVDDELEVFGGERGTQFVPGGPGEYSLQISTDAPWMLVVED